MATSQALTTNILSISNSSAQHTGPNDNSSITKSQQTVQNTSETVFAIKRQYPNAHLRDLRGQSGCSTKDTHIDSPVLGNRSDAYLRLRQNQYKRDRAMLVYQDELLNALGSERLLNHRELKRARNNVNQMAKDYRAWCLDCVPVDKLCDEIASEREFWLSWSYDLTTTKVEDGSEKRQWWASDNNANTFGDQLEVQLQKVGCSLHDKKTFEKALLKAQKVERNLMMQHLRREVCTPKSQATEADNKANVRPINKPQLNTMSEIFDDEADDVDDDDSHLYDFTGPSSSAKGSSEETVKSNSNTQLYTISKTTDEEDDDVDEDYSNFYDFSPPTASTETTTSTTTCKLYTDTDAILNLAKTLVTDITELRTHYAAQVNTNMDTLLYQQQQARLSSCCTWTVRPMAMTPRNRSPPPMGEPPAVRLITPQRVTCQLTEAFQDLSDPCYAEYFQEREDAQAEMAETLKNYRVKDESYNEYMARLAKEEFWERCLVKDNKREAQESRMRVEDGDYETDSDDQEDHIGNLCSSGPSIASSSSSVAEEQENLETPLETTNDNNNDSIKAATRNVAEVQAALDAYNITVATIAKTIKEKHIERMRNIRAEPKRIAADRELAVYLDVRETREAVNIMHLKLRMDEDGMDCANPQQTLYKATKSIGPGAIEFVGPLRKVMTAGTSTNRLYNTTMNEIHLLPHFQQYRALDRFAEAKESLSRITKPKEVKCEAIRTMVQTAQHTKEKDKKALEMEIVKMLEKVEKQLEGQNS